MTRQRVVQKAPPDELDGFPERIHDGIVFRAARVSPWWFCNCGHCRFDLEAAGTGQGTLYAGTDEITGVLETIGPELIGRTIARGFLDNRTVWGLAYDRPVFIADLTADEAVGFGVTNELSTMVPYGIPQLWADAFEQHGLDGISYRTRFNTGAEATGVALFVVAGDHTDWPASRVRGMNDSVMVTELNRRHVTVEDPPALVALTVL